MEMEEETTLCFCVVDEGRCRWYTIPLSPTLSSLPQGPNCTILSSIPPHTLPHYFTSVSLGPKIYMIGGINHPAYPSSSVTIVDSNLPDYRPYYTYFKGIPMIGGKAFPISSIVDGKIYVLGSSCGAMVEEEPWGEVFDPSKGRWESLPDPPPEIRRLSACSPSQHVLYEKYKKILVAYDRGGHTAFCFFDTVNNTWGALFSMPSVKMFMSPGRHVIVNHHLYMFDKNLYAYDLTQTEFNAGPPVKVNGLEEATDSMFHPYDNSRKFLYHLGKQKLCLVWSVWCDEPESGLKIYCVIFRVRKQGNSLHAVVLHQVVEPYFVARGFELCDCLIVKQPKPQPRPRATTVPDTVVPDVPSSNNSPETESQDSSKMKSEDAPVSKSAPDASQVESQESDNREIEVEKVYIDPGTTEKNTIIGVQ
ncbi:hypothetical protein ACHQM5_003150 [Ranunculus cassubicifolius]